MFHTFCLLHCPCTERFEPLPSLGTSKKQIGHIANIKIWSYNLKFSEKTVLYFDFTALCTGCPEKT